MTDNEKREYLIAEFAKHNVDKDEYLPIVDFIIRDGYDITDWEIQEIPVKGQYCFNHRSKPLCFDI